MGQQQEMVAEQQAGGALRCMVVALAVATIMAAMMALTASPAFADGRGFAKGQNDTNPSSVNDYRGDDQNNIYGENGSHGKCNPYSYGTTNSPNGGGVQNN